jgi:hypothetical protein
METNTVGWRLTDARSVARYLPHAPMQRKYLDLLLFIGLSLLLCHELDAVAQAEWRLLPVLRMLTDASAYPIFVWLHVPLFALVLWWTGSTSVPVRRRAQFGVDAFLVIHAGLRTALRSHDYYTFHSTLSMDCMYGAAVIGTVHAPLTWRMLASER